MKAVCWYGKGDMRVENVPDPKIRNDHDIIVKVTSTAICGSDLHIYDGYMPGMRRGDILGHEFMGEVKEIGKAIKNVVPGDRVLVPFGISCGQCFYCKHGFSALCDNSNPNAWLLEKFYESSGSGLFGYSHLYGGFAGGQAEYVRVPFGNVGPLKINNDLPDERVLFLTDIFPTGFMAAEFCHIRSGNVIAVWGCGPVGLMAIKSAYMLGAEHVIAIDRVPERLALAESFGGAETLDESKFGSSQEVVEELIFRTGGRGPDACIDAVGMEAHGHGAAGAYDKLKQNLHLQTDHPTVIRQMIHACRKAGTISIPGVYGGYMDKIPMGVAFGKGLILRMGQCNVHKYMAPLLERVEKGEIDLSKIITHRLSLEDAPRAYRIFRNKEDGCVKVVMRL